MTAASDHDENGLAPVPGGHAWWRQVGTGRNSPLLLLHGGTGTGHDYLLPMAALSADRPVIFYDQLGCGRSDAPEDEALYRIPRFVEEVDANHAGLLTSDELEQPERFNEIISGFIA